MVEKAEILLVDDHALILEGICQILKRIPEVVVADAVTTGKEAVGQIGKKDKRRHLRIRKLGYIFNFYVFANLPQYVKEPYKRFLENKMREKWNLTGTPINIYIRQK